MDHEGGLAHLAGVEHVAILALQQTFVKVPVRLALDVGGSVLAEGPAGDIEAGGVRAHRISRRSKRAWVVSAGSLEVIARPASSVFGSGSSKAIGFPTTWKFFPLSQEHSAETVF